MAPSSPTGETEPLAGTTSYTGVIRGADEAEGDWCAHVTLARIYREERDAALEGIIRRDDALGIYDAEVTRLHTSLDAKDATIDRLWAQLNEATNVPDHNDPEFGFDKTAALSEPTPWCGCHICTRHGQIKSKP